MSHPAYPSKMVPNSKQTFVCHVSNETDPNHVGFFIFGKIKQQAGTELFQATQSLSFKLCCRLGSV